jgi:hypothetical protein
MTFAMQQAPISQNNLQAAGDLVCGAHEDGAALPNGQVHEFLTKYIMP